MAANDDLLDSITRRQINLMRFGDGLADRVVAAMDASEKAIASLMRQRLDAIAPGGRFPSRTNLRKLNAMIHAQREIRTQAMRKAKELARVELAGMIEDEAQFIVAAMTEAIGIEELVLDVPTLRRMNATTFGTPFGGRKFNQWFGGLEQADSKGIEAAIRAGYFEGDGIEQIVNRVRGTSTLRGVDGATNVTRNSTRTLVRTTTNAFSNAAREAVFEQNSDIIGALVWVSTLDGRTSAICQARDGHIAPTEGKTIPDSLSDMPRLQPPSARPPAHPNCRSIMTAVLDGEGVLGTRPSVTDTRTPRKREVDFRRQARDSGRPIQDIRRDWADKNIGRIPAKTNYQQFLGRQNAGFQDDLLGPTRGALFRRGGLTLDKFVDTTGRRFTLPELRASNPGAFAKANLTSAT